MGFEEVVDRSNQGQDERMYENELKVATRAEDEFYHSICFEQRMDPRNVQRTPAW
jgi:hypothetical protein